MDKLFARIFFERPYRSNDIKARLGAALLSYENHKKTSSSFSTAFFILTKKKKKFTPIKINVLVS